MAEPAPTPATAARRPYRPRRVLVSAPAAPRAGLRRSAGRLPYARGRCEVCLLPIGAAHRHLVDTAQRVLACACPACALLFDGDGAAGGRLRAVPERFLYDPDWDGGAAAARDALVPPIGSLAFYFRNSALDRIVALRPGPDGGAEAEIEPDAWERAFGGCALARALADDVEALLVRRRDDGRADCHLVPVDAAYALAGRLRRTWSGIGVGPRARAELDAFYGRLARDAVPLEAGPGMPAV